MARPSKAQEALEWSLTQLKEELETPGLPAARRRSLLREYNRAALSLSKLTQLAARIKLQATKPATPPAKPKAKSILEEWAANLDSTTEGVRNVLGGPVEERQASQPTPVASNATAANSELAEGTSEDTGAEDDESEDNEEDHDHPANAETAELNEAEPGPVHKADTLHDENRLSPGPRNGSKEERAEYLRRFYVEMPGLRQDFP